MGLLVLTALTACDKQSRPARSVLECRVGVIEPVLGPLALDVLGECARFGNETPLRAALERLELKPSEIADVADAWHACESLPADAGVR